MSDRCLILIPTYNERDNVARVWEQIEAAVAEMAVGVEVLFIDDGSPDGTGALLDEMAVGETRVHVLHRERKEGLGPAYLAGFAWALRRDYALLLQMDADLSHDPGEVAQFLARAERADVVVGTRYRGGGVRVINWPIGRLILSKGAAFYVRLVTGMPLSDPTGGYNLFRREVLEELDLDALTATGYSFLVELKHRAWMNGFRIDELPIIFHERRSGVSKMNAAIVREALLLVWHLVFKERFRRRPRVARHERSVVRG